MTSCHSHHVCMKICTTMPNTCWLNPVDSRRQDGQILALSFSQGLADVEGIGTSWVRLGAKPISHYCP